MSCELATINRSYPWSSKVTVMTTELLVDGNTVQTPYAIHSGSSVRAAILDRAGLNILAGPVDCLEAATGSDWANGGVVVTFLQAELSSLSDGRARLSVEVDDGFEASYQVGVNITSGANI